MILRTVQKSFAIMICFFIFWVGVAKAEIAIVVNNSNPTVSLSTSDLVKIFKGRKTEWDSGGKINPAVLKDGADDFYSLINMTKSTFNKYWIKLSLSGKAQPLTQLGSDSEMVQYVKSHENSIGIIKNTENAGDVKVITIEE